MKLMNPDFSAAIYPLLREVASGPPGTCGTIELCADNNKWVQFMDQTINAAYPFEDDPETRLPELLKRSVVLEVSTFAEGSFLTLSVKDILDKAVIDWVEDYIVDVLGCDRSNLTVDTWIEQL
jgi:hypothetical protein